MITEKNSTYLFVGNVSKGTATKLSALPNGAVAIVDAATGAIQSGAISNTSKPYKVVMKTSTGKLIFSPAFTLGDVKMKGAEETATLDTQQVSYLGATATDSVTGIGNPTVGKAYVVNVIMRNLGLINTTPEVRFAAYKAQEGDTQFEFVEGLRESFDRQLNNPYDMVIIDRVCNGSVSTATNDVTVVKGSTVVTTDETVSVGDVFKIRGVAYKVVATGSGEFTIDTPYTGASETITGSSNAETGKTTSITVWGLRFTGVRQEFNPNTDGIEGQLLHFEIYSEDLDVEEYVAQKATPKITDGARLAYLERYSQFLHKQPVVSARPATTYQAEVNPTKAYKLYTLNIKNDVEGSIAIGTDYKAATSIVIAVENNVADQGLTTILGIS